MDGILEWRFIWANRDPTLGELSRPRYQPVLSHKVACIGRSQARLFESWGNLGRCEVMGLPRLDALLGRRPRSRVPGEPFRLLIATARMPAFTHGQLRLVEQSLRDMKEWRWLLRRRPHRTTPTPRFSEKLSSPSIEVTW
jgi:hypothetical protein